MWRDPATRTALVSQLRATLYLVPGSGQQEGLHEFDDQLKPILHGLQLVWILVGSAAVGGWLGIPWRAKCLLLVPVLYLGVHLVYQVAVYYPRHIIMGHVAMGVMSMLALAVARGGARFAILQSRSGD
jgi:hypothetical protein